MKKFSVIDVNEELIGNIYAHGDTKDDWPILDRLDEVGVLLTRYVETLVDNAKRIDDYRASVQDVALKSKDILEQLKEQMVVE